MLVVFPDERLRQKSLEADFSEDLQILIHNMFAVMYQYKGVGLSAIQIGMPLRVIVADVGNGREIYINPKIERIGGTKKLMKEGCLSFPGIYEDVERYSKITVSYQDINQVNHIVNTGGLRAQMLQHEIEHLDGVLLSDKVAR